MSCKITIRRVKLKLCPFCGGTPRVEQSANDYFSIECKESSCWASGPMRSSLRVAVNAWNTRSRLDKEITIEFKQKTYSKTMKGIMTP